jgi:hypothetical protein
MKNAISIVALLALLAPLRAQDEPKPLTFGGFTHQGSFTTGVRFTDVNGSRDKFNELFGLRGGFRVFDISLFGSAQDGEKSFADSYSLTASGLGGDPYSTVQLTARKQNLYDLRVSFRQARFYWNRSDALLPNGFNGLTSNHDWATVRKMGSMNLIVNATRQLRFNFEYFRNTREGMNFSTRTLEYFGASSTFAGFARANPYYVAAPMNQVSNRITAGFDYSWKEWNVHQKVGYQTFEDEVNGNNIGPFQRSINIDEANTSRELLNGLGFSQYRRLKTPVSETSYNGNANSKLELRGGYMFYRYSGPATLDMSFDGLSRTSVASVVAPYAVSLRSRAHVTEPNHIIDQGFTLKPAEWWNILLDYRYLRLTTEANGEFRSVTDNATGPATVALGEAESHWRIGTHTLDFNTAFYPSAKFTVRAGVRLLKSDITATEDGVVDLQRTKRIKTAWPIGSVFFQPTKMLTVRFSADMINNGTSYTRITPHTDKGARWVILFKPTEKLHFENSAVFRNRKLSTTDFTSTVRANASVLTFEADPRFSIYAGFSYDSFFASDFVNFLRGTAPFTGVTLRDQTISRLWQAGFRAEPVTRLGLSLTGNYLRTTGMGEFLGEMPLYGPIKHPYATGSLYYDFPGLGKLELVLQRTYYSEQIISANNFSANMLTIRWARGF